MAPSWNTISCIIACTNLWPRCRPVGFRNSHHEVGTQEATFAPPSSPCSSDDGELFILRQKLSACLINPRVSGTTCIDRGSDWSGPPTASMCQSGGVEHH